MKTLFSRRRNSYLGSGASGVFALVVVIVVVVLVAIRFLLPGVFTAIASPLWSIGGGLSGVTANGSAFFGDKAKLAGENAQLRASNTALGNENRILLERAADIEKLVGTSTPEGVRIAAGVLARPPVSPYDTLIIAGGKSAGMTLKNVVFGPGNVPIGTLSVVTDASATVTLFSAPGRITSGWAGDKRIPLSLTGVGGGAFKAQVPRDAGIITGDIVYVPGPGALPIGNVVHVDTNPSNPESVIQIQPALNLFSLTWVSVARGTL